MPCIAYRRGYLPSTFALLSRLSASPLPLSPSPLFLLSTSRLRLYPSLHSSPSTSPLLRFFASPPTRPVSPGTLSSSCLPLQMPRINYLVLGSTKIGVIVDIAQDLPVQALVDVVFNARSFNCKPADLQVYRVDVPLTEAGIPPQYTPVRLKIFPTISYAKILLLGSPQPAMQCRNTYGKISGHWKILWG